MVPEDTLAFGSQTQRYIRAHKIALQKNRRCFTALHHHTSLSRLTSPAHNSEFRQIKRRRNFAGYTHLLNPEYPYCLIGLPDFFGDKAPLFCLMRNCEGNFRTEGQKNGSPESFGMRLSEEGDREF